MIYEYYTAINRDRERQIKRMNSLKILGSKSLSNMMNVKPDPKYSACSKTITLTKMIRKI